MASQLNWEVRDADPAAGSISVRNLACGPLDTSESCIVMFVVKSLDPKTTSVSIAPAYQRVDGGDQLLMAVKDSLACESKN